MLFMTLGVLGGKISARQRKVIIDKNYIALFTSVLGKTPCGLRRGKWRLKVCIKASWNQCVGFHPLTPVSCRSHSNHHHIATSLVWIPPLPPAPNGVKYSTSRRNIRDFTILLHTCFPYSVFFFFFFNGPERLWISSQGFISWKK